MKVEKGDKIKIEYEGKLEDGTVFDTSNREGKQNLLEFTAGVGQVIPGFDNAIVGMEKDEKKEITLEPEQAYGKYQEGLKKQIPKDMLPKEQTPEKGMALMLSTPDGKQFPAKIVEVGDKEITVDLNHPLAGKKLVFNFKVIEIEKK